MAILVLLSEAACVVAVTVEAIEPVPSIFPVTLPVTLPVMFPVTLPDIFPVTLPVTFPVTSPVTGPTKVVAVKAPVAELKVKLLPVLGSLFPVASVVNRGKH